MTVFKTDSAEHLAAKLELKPLRDDLLADDKQRYLDAYKTKFGKDSTLSDDQLFDMIARSDDDMDDDDWALFMQSIEDGKSDEFADQYNVKITEIA